MKKGLKLSFAGLALVLALSLAGVVWYSVGLLGGSDVTDSATITNAFREEFGEQPSSDIEDIQFRRSGSGDLVWFTFRATQRTIEPLLRRFEPADRSAYEKVSRRPGSPSWSRPSSDKVTFYRAYDWSPNVDASVAVLCLDQATSTIYFSRLAID